MYQAGQQVIYGMHGVCNILAVESMRFGKERARYYVLQPVEQPDSRFYVPVNNETAVSKLRPLMSREELLSLLHAPQNGQDAWIPEENQRKLRYRELLAGADRGELLRMIYSLHRHKKEQLAAGRKFHQCDEAFLHDAQKLLDAEFCQVFGLNAGQVNAFIIREMGIQEK